VGRRARRATLFCCCAGVRFDRIVGMVVVAVISGDVRGYKCARQACNALHRGEVTEQGKRRTGEQVTEKRESRAESGEAAGGW